MYKFQTKVNIFIIEQALNNVSLYAESSIFCKYVDSYLCFSQKHSQSQFLLHGWVLLSKTVAFCELAYFAHVSKMFLLLYLWWTIFLANKHQTDSSFKSYEEQFFLFWIFGGGVYVILATNGAAIFIHVYFSPITEQSLESPHLLFYALLYTCRQRLIWLWRCVYPPVLVLSGMFLYTTIYHLDIIVA